MTENLFNDPICQSARDFGGSWINYRSSACHHTDLRTSHSRLNFYSGKRGNGAVCSFYLRGSWIMLSITCPIGFGYLSSPWATARRLLTPPIHPSYSRVGTYPSIR